MPKRRATFILAEQYETLKKTQKIETLKEKFQQVAPVQQYDLYAIYYCSLQHTF